MKKIAIALHLFFIAFVAMAQEQQDLSRQKLLEKFPKARILIVEFRESLNRNFTSELFDQKFQEGTVDQRFYNVQANVPFYKDSSLLLMGYAGYQYHEFEFTDIKSNSSISNSSVLDFEQNGSVDFHYLSAGTRAIYRSTLFKKPVVYIGSVFADGNDEAFERVKGSLRVLLFLKKTSRTSLGVGANILFNPTSQIPYMPLFIFSHNFNDSWALDAALPYKFFFRRRIGKNQRISFGNRLESVGFYMNEGQLQPIGDVFEFSQLEMKSGIVYEHSINKYLVGTLKTGLLTVINSQLTEKAEPAADAIYTNSQDPTGYFQIGISIKPFSKKGTAK